MEVEATVVELLPNATYRVGLENEQRVLAHAAGAAVKNFVRFRPGDRVRGGDFAARSDPGQDLELLRRSS